MILRRFDSILTRDVDRLPSIGQRLCQCVCDCVKNFLQTVWTDAAACLVPAVFVYGRRVPIELQTLLTIRCSTIFSTFCRLAQPRKDTRLCQPGVRFRAKIAPDGSASCLKSCQVNHPSVDDNVFMALARVRVRAKFWPTVF